MRPMSGKIMRVFVLVLVVMMLSASAMAEFSAAVFCPVMKVYFGPSTSSEQIGALRMGTTVTVEASSGDWARINYKGYVGFARVEDLISLGLIFQIYLIIFLTLVWVEVLLDFHLQGEEKGNLEEVIAYL